MISSQLHRCQIQLARAKLCLKFAVACLYVSSLTAVVQADIVRSAKINSSEWPINFPAQTNIDESGFGDSELILIAQNSTEETTNKPSDVENSEADAVLVEEVKTEPKADYLKPKTVYIGVDSIASPVVLPETAALPLPSGSQAEVDDQSTTSLQSESSSQPIVETEVSEPDDSAAKSEVVLAPVDNTQQTENAPVSTDTETTVTKQETTAAVTPKQSNEPQAVIEIDDKKRAPEIQQVKTESINSVSKRITLYKTIDIESELDVPGGLPEDLNENQDHRELLDSQASIGDDESQSENAEGKTSEVENQLTKIEDDSADAEELVNTNENTQSESAQDEVGGSENAQDDKDQALKKPAVVVNIDENLTIDSRNEWGWTKLMSAAIEGNLQRVNELLQQGANPDIAGEDGRSPLMAASWNKHYEIVDSLINARADVNLSNRDGWTALSFAAWNGDVVIVKNLLRVAANKFKKTADGFTPLQLAEQKGHQEIVELLQ